MGKILQFLFVALLIGGAYNWLTAGSREPDLSVPLADEDAFTLASTILARGKVTGCGDFRVVSQSFGGVIRVECGRGKTAKEHRISYFPDFEVDWEPVADRNSMSGLLNEERLARIHCVQLPDGTWDKAYLRESDALRRAEEMSAELKKGATVFHGYDGTWVRMGDDGDGTWSMDSGKYKMDKKGYGPDGCRI